MAQRAHLLISGIVQGVFYRAFTKQNADAIGLSGWVRNTADGSVEAVLEGEKEAIERMIKICRQGPPASVVRSVDVRWESGSEELSGFQIRY
ncbi:MAG: acylphosphatase [Nitrospiraceae bacterium]|nr:acylphosphatase [Nitrospiraceae bacterium]